MSERTPDDQPSDPPAGDEAPADDAASGSMPDGYEYSVVDDNDFASAETAPRERSAGLHPLLLAALAIVPAVLVGVLVWFAAGAVNGNGDGDRVTGNVANVINAFSQGQQGVDVQRFEGELPPGFPAELPRYPGSRVVASVLQISGNDASFLVVFDTDDARQRVATYFEDQFSSDPWQIELGQSNRSSSLHQFSNIEDADIEGLVLSAESKGDHVTTIFMSVQVVGGVQASDPETFEPGVGRPVPAGFPADDVPQYPDAILIESAYQTQPNERTYLITLVTRDDAQSVLSFYREHFESNDWAVEDGDATQTPVADAETITFTSPDTNTTGGVLAGEFDEDDSYTRIDVTVRATR